MRRFISSTVAFLCVAILYAAQYVVTADKLNLRTAPSKTAAVGITAAAGDELNVAEVNGEWAQVEIEGQTYYCAVKYLEATSEETPEEVKADSSDKWKDMLQYFKQSNWRHTSNLPLYLGLLLLAGFTIIYFACDYDLFEKRKDLFYIGCGAFVCLCLLELAHFMCYDYDTTWFCSQEVSWWWSAVNFLLFTLCCYVQAVTFVRLARAFHHHGGRKFNNGSGYILTAAAIIALIVDILFIKSKDIVLYVDALAFVGWIGWLCYCNYRDKGSWLNVIMLVGFWIIGMLASLLVYLHYFLVILVLLSIAICVIMGFIIFKVLANGLTTPGSFFNLFGDSAPAPTPTPIEGPDTGELKDSDGNNIPVEFMDNGQKAIAKDFSGRKFRKTLSGGYEEYH